jgi:ABC-type transport system substrate-binding protein
VSHLKTAYSGFDYFAMLPATIPVPKAKDPGVTYKEHVISSGAYMFQSYEQGKSIVLVRNPNWDPATDPQWAVRAPHTPTRSPPPHTTWPAAPCPHPTAPPPPPADAEQCCGPMLVSTAVR